jgi:hypothetical protein
MVSEINGGTTNNKNDDNDDGVVQCPCSNFASIPKVLESLDSEERTQALLDWLAGNTDEISLQNSQRLSCGKRLRCRYRVGISFAVVNAIRDACKPFLEPGTVSNLTAATATTSTVESISETSEKKPVASYEEAFPSLGVTAAFSKPTAPHPAADNILVPRKKSNATMPTTTPTITKKEKRRIRPQLTAASLPNSMSVWGQQSTLNATEAATFGSFHGNIASLQSQDPLTPVKRKPSSTSATSTMIAGDIAATSSALAFTSAWGQQSTLNTTTATTTFGSFHGNIASLPSQDPLTPVRRKPSAISATSAILAGDITADSSSLAFSRERNETPPKSTTSKKVKPISEEHFRHLVDVYSALIANHLVPSTALELHLLLRLLTVNMAEDDARPIQGTGDETLTCFFAPYFSSPERCRSFATLSLCKLSFILRNLGLPLVKGLVQCAPFCMELPDLSKELKSVIRDHISRGILNEYRADEVTGTHAILTLPFEHDRDSRHNYRTQAEMEIYKNREESRDAFLYQLRAFMNVRGKMLHDHEAERAMDRIRLESRNVMNGVLRDNLVWFAQFFCDLLLQIGLAPMQETDKELLNIADKDKLQVRYC